MKIVKQLISILFLLCSVIPVLAQRPDIEELGNKANAGDAEAQYRIGSYYQYGQYGLEKNEATALVWIKKSAAQGYAGAYANLAYYYQDHNNTAARNVWRDKLLQKAKAGDACAQYHASVIYIKGSLGVTKDVQYGQDLLIKSAQQNYPNAITELTLAYGHGLLEFPEDYTEVVKWAKIGTSLDMPLCECILGDCYNEGKGIDRNDKEAVKLWKKTAAKGYSLAMSSLAYYYEDINKEEAIDWWKKYMDCKYAENGEEDSWAVSRLKNFGVEYHPADKSTATIDPYKELREKAADGDAESQYSLGVKYSVGDEFITKDEAEAFKWTLKAAEQGHVDAQYRVANMYHNGNGVQKDEANAFKWCRKAAEQGHEYAQHDLGKCYIRGIGVTKNVAEGLKWYKRSAAQGYEPAMFSLGLYYKNINKDEAIYWFKTLVSTKKSLSFFEIIEI